MSEAGSSILTIRTFGWAVRLSPPARRCASIIGRYLSDMETEYRIITSRGETIREAWIRAYDMMLAYYDDVVPAEKVGDEYIIRLELHKPKPAENL